MENSKKKGPRVIVATIIFLVILFFTIEFFIRETQEFSTTTMTNILLSSLQIIVLLLFLILLSVLGRNLIKLYMERKRKVLGAHFKTKIVLFFTALSLVPTLLLFFFASDLVSRNIETWFKTPIDKILDDTKDLADGFYENSEELTLHYARQLSRTIQNQKLINLERRLPLIEFTRNKLSEYKLDEIGIYMDDEELFTCLNPDLPLYDYRDVKKNIVKRAHLGEVFSSIDPMGNGEMIRRGERVSNLAKLVNVREGFSRRDDRVPEIWFNPMDSPEGTIETRDYFNTKVIEKEDAERMLDDYYDERGWDIDKGTPTQEKLKELGLEQYSN